MSNRGWRRLAVLLALAFCWGCAHAATGPEPAEISEIRYSQLPTEAKLTLRLIARGGPYPYQRDGAVFGNFERLLPLRQRGYYREYTVPTPGARDRGARRIVAGGSGERYYTDDHYRSFRRVRE